MCDRLEVLEERLYLVIDAHPLPSDGNNVTNGADVVAIFSTCDITHPHSCVHTHALVGGH